jgi:hypothetical protein
MLGRGVQRAGMSHLRQVEKLSRLENGLLNVAGAGAVAGGIGGLAYGLVDEQLDKSRFMRSIQRAMNGVVCSAVGIIGGFVLAPTAPVWMPLLGLGFAVDLFQTGKQKK